MEPVPTDAAALAQRVSDLEAELAELRRTSSPTRRRLLGLTGTAMAGAVVGMVGRPGSASATVDTMQFGTDNNAGSDDTVLRSSSTAFTLEVRNSNVNGRAMRVEHSGGGTALWVLTNGIGVDTRGVVALNNSDSGYALEASGGRSPIRIGQSDDSGPGAAGSGLIGELAGIEDQGLWYAIAGSGARRWRKLAGPATAGSLHPIPTARVYDSRWTNVFPNVVRGPMAAGTDRLVVCDDKRNPANGLILDADAIPSGALAVAYNLTVTAINGTGFLAIEPGDVTVAGGSAINYWTGATAIANASISKLDSSRRLRVFCGGSTVSVHLVIDIVGYYL